MFALRMLSSQRRKGRGAPGQRSSFTGPGPQGPRRPPPTNGVDRPAPPGTAVTGTASSGLAPGWFTDPSLRHQERYWSGTAWTEHVTDDGVPGIDPPPDTGEGR